MINPPENEYEGRKHKQRRDELAYCHSYFGDLYQKYWEYQEKERQDRIRALITYRRKPF